MQPKRADNYLLSVCLVQEGDLSDELARLVALSDDIGRDFKYFEILYVIGQADRAELNAQASVISAIKNIRIIILNGAHSMYRKRAIVAGETIGDVVVLTTFGELQALPLKTVAETVFGTNKPVLVEGMSRRVLIPLFHVGMRTISRFNVNAKDTRTLGVPRAALSRFLASQTVMLDLLYEPSWGADSYPRIKLPEAESRSRYTSPISHRLELAAALFSSSASLYLRAFAALSFLVTLLAGLYAVYSTCILLFHQNIQQGWYSTSIVQSGTVGFVALGLAIICLGLSEIYDRLFSQDENLISEEVSNTNLFEYVTELNIELGGSVPLPEHEQRGRPG